ncbi:MAG: immune inhibitor A [Chloroflexi bacterium]|nr:immune inhibitor A [Chloroflexota bacterium]
MSVNVHFLPAASWPAVSRAVRNSVIGALVAGTLLLPFPLAPRFDHARPTLDLAVRPGDTLAAQTPSDLIAQPSLRAAEAGQDWSVSADEGGPLLASMPAEATDTGITLPPLREIPLQVEADERLTTLERLLATPRPARDPIALAGRVSGTLAPWTASQPFSGPLAVGHQTTFFVLDQTDNTYKTRAATLRLVSGYAYWYVQDGETVRDDELALAAKQFDEQTVPTVHRVFGTEWMPGIDGDARITIFLGQAPGVGAYFSSWDEYPRSVYRYSNEREMIHVNVSSVRPGSVGFDGTIAHEYQHMVHWHLNPQDDTWVDEGMAELASSLAVRGRSPSTASFQRQPDVQLTAWSQGAQTGLHYQAAYLFSRYFAQRFGEDAVARLLSETGRPPDTVTAFLSRSGLGITFEDVFEDWIVANLLDDPTVGDGRFAHEGLEHRATPTLSLRPDGQPARSEVQQFGAEYVELTGDGSDAELSFAGASSVRLVGADAASGRNVWWTNRADGMDSSLTRRFDLTGLTGATLRFNLWYDTERDFDFLYVLVSTDGGTRWHVLHGPSADDANPTGNAIGPGYSGRSGQAGSQRGDPTWLAESIDLTPFAGREVLVRFEYVTDQGYNAQGALLDDIEIPELAFRDDAEADAGWTAEGFLRSANQIPQTWSLRLVEQQRGGQTTVRALRVDANGQLTERIPSLGGSTERAVLVISGLSPRTLEAAPYTLTLRPR